MKLQIIMRILQFLLGKGLLALTLFLGLGVGMSAEVLFAQQVDDKVSHHQKLKRQIDEAYAREEYTFESPFVQVNPFKNNSLVAELRFNSTYRLQVSILVKEADGSYYEQAHSEFLRNHRYPVLGLYPNTANEVIISGTTRAGKNFRTQIVIQTEALPEDYPDLKSELKVVKRHQTSYKKGFYSLMLVKRKLQGGATFLYSVLDSQGDVRWLNTELKGHIFKRTGRGTAYVTLANIAHNYHSDKIYEMDNYGQYLGVLVVPSYVHHELQILPDQNVLLLSNSKDYIEDTVVEFDYETGKVKQEWNLADYIPKEREPLPGFAHVRNKDWAHLNGLDYDAKTDSFFVSSRNQSAIVAINRGSGKLKWISGPHDNWTDKERPYLLNLLGDTLLNTEASKGENAGEWHWGQHCVRVLGNGHFLIFDNGRSRSFDFSKKLYAFQTYSRAVEYVIDEEAKTTRQVWEFGKDYGHELYSSYVSGVQYLESEDAVLINFGGITKDYLGNPIDDAASHNSVRLFEVKKDASKTVLFELSVKAQDYTKRYGFRAYRANKFSDISF